MGKKTEIVKKALKETKKTVLRKNPLLEFLFNPKSIAIIGASEHDGKIGFVILSNFIRNFRGKIFPINPKHQQLLGLQCFPSVKAVREEIDAAVIAVPAAIVPQVLKECGQKKIKAVTIISSGFLEVGNEKLQKELEKTLKQFPKTLVLGPNCLGALDTVSGVDMLFLPPDKLGRPGKGSVSFISQSGALGSAILDWDSMKGYGINKFVSYGNAVAVNESDLLAFLAEDASTKVITVYIEGVKNGKKFFETLKETSLKKPVIVLKGGSSEKGREAISSHTAALAGSIEVFKAVLKQCNAIQACSMEEVFDFARVFNTEPKNAGKKVQVITNGGGYGILAADALQEQGLELAEMSEECKQAIREKCPAYAVIKNPVDLTGDADNERFKTALEQALQDSQVDAVMLILLFQVPRLDERVIEIVKELAANRKKPLLVVSAGGTFSEKQSRRLEEAGISTFQSPFQAAKCLKALNEYYGKLKEETGK